MKFSQPVETLPPVKTLPDPFTFSDGTPVRTNADWARRRDEVKELYQTYMYGHMPPRPDKMTIIQGEMITDKNLKVSIQLIELRMEQAGRSLTMHLRVALPLEVKTPLPVVIQGRFARPSNPNVTELPVAPAQPYVPFTARGYAVAEFDFADVAIDNKEKGRTGGVYQLFGEDIDCGTLMAWAWGTSRTIDVLEKLPQIDTTKIMTTGHSRYGKAALVAGAFDDRIAVTIPSHSGAAGSAPYRFIYGKSEQLNNSVSYAPQWFQPHFDQFVGQVERLPVDSHLLMALVAPRALLKTEGTKDTWTNPEGAQLTYLAAKKVYQFLGANDKISIRFRPVAHVPSIEDELDYADHIFFGKPLTKEFGRLAYPLELNAYHWDVPH